MVIWSATQASQLICHVKRQYWILAFDTMLRAAHKVAKIECLLEIFNCMEYPIISYFKCDRLLLGACYQYFNPSSGARWCLPLLTTFIPYWQITFLLDLGKDFSVIVVMLFKGREIIQFCQIRETLPFFSHSIIISKLLTWTNIKWGPQQMRYISRQVYGFDSMKSAP